MKPFAHQSFQKLEVLSPRAHQALFKSAKGTLQDYAEISSSPTVENIGFIGKSARRTFLDVYQNFVRNYHPGTSEDKISKIITEFRNNPVLLTSNHTQLDINPMNLYPTIFLKMVSDVIETEGIPTLSGTVVKFQDALNGIQDKHQPNRKRRFGADIIYVNEYPINVTATSDSHNPFSYSQGRHMHASGVRSDVIGEKVHFHIDFSDIGAECSEKAERCLRRLRENLRSIKDQDTFAQLIQEGNKVIWEKYFESAQSGKIPISLESAFDREVSAQFILNKDLPFYEIFSSYDGVKKLKEIGLKTINNLKAEKILKDTTNFFWDIRNKKIKPLLLTETGFKTKDNIVIPFDPKTIAQYLRKGSISPSLFMQHAAFILARIKTFGGNFQIGYSGVIRAILSNYLRESGKIAESVLLHQQDYNRLGAPINDWTEYFDIDGGTTFEAFSEKYRNMPLVKASDNFSGIINSRLSL